ncbi:MAG: DUF1501 domain-containing protein [Planctomycetota bacterium]|nr:DUF1501 domain-containing protein [Planctomycetota bacterium]
MNTAFTRREFLGSGLVLASAAITAPSFLQASAKAMAASMGGLSSAPGVPEERILVVVQLGGGNDGLNTIVPFGMPEYHRLRPGIRIEEGQALKLSGPRTDGIGLHPQLAPVKELYDQGLVSIVQGVGYPNPNRSHFKSMDIWHTADTSATGDGWLGRYFDSQCCGFGKGESGRVERAASRSKPVVASAPAEAANAGPASGGGHPPGISLGRESPLALEGRRVKPTAFQTPELFKWIGTDVNRGLSGGYDALVRREAEAASADTNANFLVRTAMDAQVSSDLIRRAVAREPDVSYPQTDLGRQMRMVASMIAAGLKTRVYYCSMGGFDTHAGQGGANGTHGQLLSQLATALRAFQNDLKKQGNDGRVLTMTFSEFGRRVGQNNSQGTDHGTAAPMMLMGSMVNAGVLTDHPSLRDLDDGDLKYGMDFRSVYAGILENWLKANSREVLGANFRALPVIRRG